MYKYAIIFVSTANIQSLWSTAFKIYYKVPEKEKNEEKKS